MSRFSIGAAGLLLALWTAGCAFEDGQPWGAVQVALSASAPTSLRTGDGRNVSFDRVELSPDAVLLFAGETSSAAAFDPADPPEGRTLCHGGHCHCGDALVSYEELAAQVAGADGDSAPLLALPAEATPATLGSAPRAIALGGCEAGCAVPRGALRRVDVTLVGLRLAGDIDGEPFELDLPLDVRISAGIEVIFDRGEPVDAALDLALTLPVELLDGIDPRAPTADTAAALAENLATFARLAVDVRRP